MKIGTPHHQPNCKMYAELLLHYEDCQATPIRAGWILSVAGGALLLILTLLAFRAWTGDGWTYDLREFSKRKQVHSFDDSLECGLNKLSECQHRLFSLIGWPISSVGVMQDLQSTDEHSGCASQFESPILPIADGEDGFNQSPGKPKTQPVPTKASIQDSSQHDDRWTIPEALIEQLERFYRHPTTASWAHTTVQIIQSLEQLDGLADTNVTWVFNRLSSQIDQLDVLTVQLSTYPARTAADAQGETANQLRQLRYSIQRRLEIWPVVHQLAQKNIERIGLVEHHHVGQFLLAARRKLNSSSVDQAWAEYLQLEPAAAAFNSLKPQAYDLKKAARVVLARSHSPSLSIDQKDYLLRAVDRQTQEILRMSASDIVDLPLFLKRMERFESHDNGATQYDLNDVYQSLLWSQNPDYQRLAEVIQTHYRNANFRVSLSEELLNRMIPSQPATLEPYRDKVMGAEVVGQNRISNHIRISLIPDPHQISMRLETYGNLRSRTTATRSGIVVENEGSSKFRIIKRLAFGQQGVFAYRPETTSQVAQRVVGLKSNLDHIPPLGWVARRIAHNKIEQQAPQTKRYAQNQLESMAEARFEREVEHMLQELESNVTQNVLHPLIAMDLEPDPVQISTTDDRVNLRYRLAGRDQMAASTARPRGTETCLMSMQIHQSAVNNILSRFELASKKFSTPELIDYLHQMFGPGFLADNVDSTAHMNADAELEFAPFDPIHVRFEQQQITMSFNLKTLRVGSGKRWKNVTMSCSYDPRVTQGFDMSLTQSDDGIRIKGKRLNAPDQLAMGVIAKAIFPEQFQISMMPPKLSQQLHVGSLQASQFVVANGWIGMSVDDPHRPLHQQAQQPHRQRLLNRR